MGVCGVDVWFMVLQGRPRLAASTLNNDGLIVWLTRNISHGLRHRMITLVSLAFDLRRASSRKLSSTVYRFDSRSGVWLVANRLHLGNTPLDVEDSGCRSTAFHLQSSLMIWENILHADLNIQESVAS